MLTLAKPLAGGLPMGAILVTADVARAIQPGDHGTTFGGGPLLAHVAHHVVQRLADPAMLAHVRETGAWFGAQLHGIAERTGRVRDIRGQGLMWGMDVHEPAAAVIARAFANGLLLVSAGEHTIRFLPPLVISRDELSAGLAILERALAA
jgi:acetylornithine/N-succinyldiaminopimelate aminotransferase